MSREFKKITQIYKKDKNLLKKEIINVLHNKNLFEGINIEEETKEVIIRKKEKTGFIISTKNRNNIGVLIENKKYFSVYLCYEFLEEHFNIEKPMSKNVDMKKIIKALKEKDYDNFLEENQRIIDIVLHKKKVPYDMFMDFKQDLMTKSFIFAMNQNKYNIRYDNEKEVFNYLYRMSLNTLINVSKKETLHKSRFIPIGEVSYHQ